MLPGLAVEGIFRVSGATKVINDRMAAYGKGAPRHATAPHAPTLSHVSY